MKEGRLKSKKAVVVAGASGIGKGIVGCFLREGADVFIMSRDTGKVEKAIQDLAPLGRMSGVAADMAEAGQAECAMNSAVEWLGGLTTIVSAAGWNTPGGTLDVRTADFEKILLNNVCGCFYPVRFGAAHLVKQRHGSIIFIGSLAGIVGWRDRVAYSASKGAVVNMTRAMALDLAPHNVRVNCINPGFVLTELSKYLIGFDSDPEAGLRMRQQMHPIGRGGTPEEVGYAAVYLASDESSWITGTQLTLDGGYTAQ